MSRGLLGILVLGTAMLAATPAAAGVTSAGVKGEALHHPRRPAALEVAATPSSGRPGARVTLQGYLASMRRVPINRLAQYSGVNLDFGGLADGLTIQSRVRWSQTRPGHFQIRLQIPAVPWLAPNGTHQVTEGLYPIAITCLGNAPIMGCAQGPVQATATFTVTKNAPLAPPARLVLTPNHAQPGTTVHVTGWAPLGSLSAGQSYGYQLVWMGPGTRADTAGLLGMAHQATNGTISGAFRVPPAQSAESAHVALQYHFNRLFTFPTRTLAMTPFAVLSPLSWQAIKIPGRVSPETNNQAMAVAGSVDALPSSQTGYLTVSRNNGAQWQRISVAQIGQLAKNTSFPAPTGNNPIPSVASVILNRAFPNSYFITVSAIAKQYGSAPPIFYTPYFSTNRGRTWSAVPTPPGSTPGNFEGFENIGSRIYALFRNSRSGSTITEFSLNGGGRWQRGAMDCPALGPCIMFGPFADTYPGMGASDPQAIWRMGPHRRWVTSTTVSAQPGGGRPSQLVPLSPSRMLLINGLSAYPLEITQNGGRSWQDVALPSLPGGPTGFLMMLTNGDLLGDGLNHWYLLKPGTRRWVEAPEVPQSGTGPMYVAPGYLWWVGGAAASPAHRVGGAIHRIANSTF